MFIASKLCKFLVFGFLLAPDFFPSDVNWVHTPGFPSEPFPAQVSPAVPGAVSGVAVGCCLLLGNVDVLLLLVISVGVFWAVPSLLGCSTHLH